MFFEHKMEYSQLFYFCSMRFLDSNKKIKPKCQCLEQSEKRGTENNLAQEYLICLQQLLSIIMLGIWGAVHTNRKSV